MEVTLKLEDILSTDEMKEIAREEFRRLFHGTSSKERILSNLAYSFGGGFVQDLITEDALETLKSKTKELLEDKYALNHFVYDKPDAWDSKPNRDLVVYNEVQKSIKENISLVRNNVVDKLQNLDLDKFQEEFDLSTIFELLIKSVKEK